MISIGENIMRELLERFFTSRNGRIVMAGLNLISVILAIRAMFKTKSSLKAIFHLASAAASGYMLFKSSKELGLKNMLKR